MNVIAIFLIFTTKSSRVLKLKQHAVNANPPGAL